LFWGALSCVLSNVLAPALFQETKGIGLVGDGARDMGLAVAKEAGCLVREIRSVKTVKEAAEEEQRHRWPLCAPIAKDATPSALLQWFESDKVYARNCATALDDKTAVDNGDGERWQLVIGKEPISLHRNLPNWALLATVRRLVPLYLRDVCERRLKVEDVLLDLAGFIERQGGTVDVQQVRAVLGVASALHIARKKGYKGGNGEVRCGGPFLINSRPLPSPS
jgi:hypothetical protein